MKKLRITVEGKSYDVEVEILDSSAAAVSRPAAPAPVAAAAAAPAAAPAPVAAPAAPVAAAPAGEAVLCPLAAIVVSVDVKPGQQVKEGDKLVTLEAMKMNTFVFSSRAGTVNQILVAAGQSVSEGQALITFA